MSLSKFPTPIVSVDWLSKNMDEPDLIILDATIQKVGAVNSDENENHLGISGARFFDIKKKFSNKNTDLPNMLPDAEAFSSACQELGINKQSKIVVYDHLGVYSSPRVWWMFHAMGHTQIAVLDGGLPEWIRAGNSLGELSDDYSPFGNFEANYQEELVINAGQVLENLQNPIAEIFDARSAGRFNATAPEPRAGLRGGHIPGSFSLPYGQVLREGKFKSPEEIHEIFRSYDLNNSKLIFSCGSGITASIILLAAELAGYKNGAVYDGSWSEWGDGDSYPVEV